MGKDYNGKVEVDAMKANVGCHVEIELLGAEGNEKMAFDIVPDQAADFAAGLLGVSTPLAQALLGHAAGSQVPYAMHDIRAVRILAVSPAQEVGAEAAEKRRAEAERAARQAQRDSAISFASSFSGKWGDYDPAGMEGWEEEKESND